MNGLNKFHTLEEANKAFKKGTTDIVKLDDTNFSKEIMKRAILMAADYAMRRIDKDSYRLSLIQTRQGFTDYLVHFNFIYLKLSHFNIFIVYTELFIFYINKK